MFPIGLVVWESLPNRYSALSLAHVCACVTGLQHSELYRFGRFAVVCSAVPQLWRSTAEEAEWQSSSPHYTAVQTHSHRSATVSWTIVAFTATAVTTGDWGPKWPTTEIDVQIRLKWPGTDVATYRINRMRVISRVIVKSTQQPFKALNREHTTKRCFLIVKQLLYSGIASGGKPSLLW